MQLQLILLSFLPALIISYFIYKKDKYDPEPKRYIALCFIFGIISTYPAIKLEEFGILELNIDNHGSIFMTFTFAFAVIAFSEEFVKFFFLRYAIYPLKAFDEPLDGIVYAVVISMGFAGLENILYVMSNPTHGYETIWVRSLTAVPAHASFAVIMGYFVGKAKFAEKNRSLLLLTGLGGAVALHGLYDFIIFLRLPRALASFTFVTLIGGILISRKLISKQVEVSKKQFGPLDEED